MFGAILGAVLPSLVGGLLNRNEQKQNRSAVLAQNAQQRDWQLRDTAQDREWFYEDRNRSEARDEAAYQRQAADLDRQVASRGIDFAKLRDQAQAAGFNPLTVLGNASAYSTERGINMSSGGGGGVSFSSGGRGYASSPVPMISSGSFVQEALERAVDTFTNTPPETDPLADALRHAQAEGEAQRAAERTRIPRSFGYDLTEQRPFSPAVVSGIPPVSRANAAVATRGRPPPSPARQSFINVRYPEGTVGPLDATVARRYDIQPYDTLTPGDMTELEGEIVGEGRSLADAPGISRTVFGREIHNRKAKPKLSKDQLRALPKGAGRFRTYWDQLW